MALANRFKFIRTASTTEHSVLRGAFVSAAALFIAICVIGVITQQIVDATGVISGYLQGRYSADFLASSGTSLRPLTTMFGIGAGAILISSIMALIWAFRIFKASTTFIAFNYIFYAVAQGIGFGTLFMAFNAVELIAIFGIAGGIFTTMATIGYFIKDGARLVPYIIGGTILSLVLAVISLILYFSGVYNDTFIMFVTVFTGALVCLYIVYDIWTLRKLSEFQQVSNGDGSAESAMTRRLMLFIGFRLASDLVLLIWTVAKIYLRSR